MATRRQVRRRSRWGLVIGMLLALLAFGAVYAYADQFQGDSDILSTGVQNNPITVTLAPGATADPGVGIEISSNGNNHVTFPVSVGVTTSNTSGTTVGAAAASTVSVTAYGDAGEATTTVHVTAPPASALTCGVTNSFSGKVNFDATGVANLSPNATSVNVNVNVDGPACAPADATAPTTTITLTPASANGDNGWYTENVNVKIAASDPDDTVAETRCVLDPASVPTSFADLPTTTCLYLGSSGADVTSDGTHTVYAASKDSNDNIETPIVSSSFKIDKTKPVITLTTPADGATYLLNQVVDADFGCTDATSDVASCTGTVDDGSAIDTLTVGAHSFTVNATDNAGNTQTTTSNYSVVYDFSGFFQPVDNLPGWNSAKAGSAIPVKFNLGGNQGTGIFQAGYPKVTQISCPTQGTVSDPIETYTSTAGGSTLTYDTTAMQYIYAWKTDKTWANKCFLFQLGLNDGSTHNFQVQFTK